MIINSGENPCSITKETIEDLTISNYKDADTMSIFHAGMSIEATVDVGKDMDVFLLIIYAFGQSECFLRPRYMKIDSNQLINPLSAKFIKWSNTFKQFVGKLPTNCLSVFDHFVGLALK